MILAIIAASFTLGVVVTIALIGTERTWRTRFNAMSWLGAEIAAAIVKQPNLTDEQQTYWDSLESTNAGRIIRACREHLEKKRV